MNLNHEHQSFDKWIIKILSYSKTSRKLAKVGVEKAFNFMAYTISINRRHGDLEFLISRWSIENYTFVAAWGKFAPTLEDVFDSAMLPLFGDAYAIWIVLDEEDKEKL